MNKVANVLGLTALMCGVAYLTPRLAPATSPAQSQVAIRFTGPTIKSLEGLNQLVTLKVNISDVLIAEDPPLRGCWLVKGDALIACDLSKAEFASRDELNQFAVLRLPKPRVLSPRVDHEKSRTWSVERTTWIPYPWDSPDPLRDVAMKQAQQLVEHAANSEDVTTAMANAELLIRKIYEPTGWTVKVEWTDESQTVASKSP
jgi:hypothetical protein